MKKDNAEIYTLLTEPKMFDAAIELLTELENLKNELFIEFWNKLIKVFEESELLSGWKIVAVSEGIFNSTISFVNRKYKQDVIFYFIYFKPNEFVYGIYFDDSNIPVKLEDLYIESKRFKEYQWRMGNKNSFEMPIYKNIKGINLKDNREFKKLLPISIDDTVKDVFDEIMSGFTKEVQNLIISHLKRNQV